MYMLLIDVLTLERILLDLVWWVLCVGGVTGSECYRRVGADAFFGLTSCHNVESRRNLVQLG